MQYARSVLCSLGFALALSLLCACGAASPPTSSLPAATPASSAAAIRVENAWARPATKMDGGMGESADMQHGSEQEGHASGMSEMAMGSTSAVYMRLVNATASPDAVVRAASEAAAAVELHTVEMENNVARMRPVSQIDIPANGMVELKPGGFHVMLLGIKQDLEPGDTVALTLTLQSGGTLNVDAPVQEQPAQ